MQGYSLITDILFLLFIAAISASFSYMLDFALGFPGKEDASEVNTKSFLFGWSFYLAKRKFNQAHLNKTRAIYNIPCAKGYNREMAERQFKIDVFAQGRELFTWEHVTGMCIYCSGFWIAWIFAAIIYALHIVQLYFIPDYFVFITTPVFSHLILRKL